MQVTAIARRTAVPGAGTAAAAWAVAVWMLVFPSPSAAQACDPALPRNDGQTSGYRPRGDRCEGVYQRLVASSGIKLVSLTAASDVADLCAPGTPLHLVWSPPAAGSGPVRVRAESLRQRLYYRLDLDRAGNASSFEWPPAPRCNNDVRLGATELGILAQASLPVGAKQADVLLPVALARAAATGARLPYRAVLVPSRRLTEIYVSLWRQGVSGAASTRIFFERPLDKSPYPPGSPVVLQLSAADVAQPGVYRVTVSAQSDSGTPEALEFHFLHGS